MSGRTLLFIIADRPSLLAAKGEITRRYYNPGDHFDHVHLLTTTNDRIDPAVLAETAGRAQLSIHSLWNGSDRAHMLMSPVLHRRWARRAIELAQSVGADVVRTGDRLSGYLGSRIKSALGVPHILSLHTHRHDSVAHMRWGIHRFLMEYEKRFARLAISSADVVIIVYESLRDYAQMYGARRVELIYNVISPELSEAKADYGLHTPPRILTVGRQIPRKMPDQIIRSIKRCGAELTVIGDGDAHDRLRRMARNCGVARSVRFVKSVPNRDLCRQLAESDIFMAHTEYPEFPKTVMEALWLGVPVVVNEDQSRPVPEFDSRWVRRVVNSADGYGDAVGDLLEDTDEREKIGRRGREFAETAFHPALVEAVAAELYAEFC